jgi:hypothetical protein
VLCDCEEGNEPELTERKTVKLGEYITIFLAQNNRKLWSDSGSKISLLSHETRNLEAGLLQGWQTLRLDNNIKVPVSFHISALSS